jgi:hypothetical protein
MSFFPRPVLLARLVAVAACVLTPLLASAQAAPAPEPAPEPTLDRTGAPVPAAPLRYQWDITAMDRVWAGDEEAPRTDRRSTTTLVTSVDLSRPDAVVLTITAIKMSVPGTSMGDLEFDSSAAPEAALPETADPEGEGDEIDGGDATEGGEAPSNPLEEPLRAMIGLPLEFRYDPDARAIRGPSSLAKMPASRILSALLSEPYTSMALYPFFENPAGDDAVKAYALVPGGPMGRLANTVVMVDTEGGAGEDGRPTLGGSFDGGVEGVMKGQLGPDGLNIAFKGESNAVYTEGDHPTPATHRTNTTTETTFEYGPNNPVRSWIAFEVSAKRLTD